jgi:CheY-like chemotaxis protein
LIVRLQVASTHNQAVVKMNKGIGAAKILCVESDPFLHESRCAVLKYSGYDSVSASPQAAEVVLRSQKFDLIVISTVSDQDLHRILNLSDGADVLVLDGLTMPSKLLSLVAQRLQRRA